MSNLPTLQRAEESNDSLDLALGIHFQEIDPFRQRCSIGLNDMPSKANAPVMFIHIARSFNS